MEVAETSTRPVVMYAGDVAVITVGETTLNVAFVPPNFMFVMFTKFAPTIVTDMPPACGP